MTDIQTIKLDSGLNYITFNVVPNNKNINYIFKNTILTESDYIETYRKKSYFNHFKKLWSGNIINIDENMMYKIFVTFPNTLSIIGEKITLNKIIQITKKNNYFPYYYTIPININKLLENITFSDNDVIINSKMQKTTYDADTKKWLSSNLKEFEPGQGYIFKTKNDFIYHYNYNTFQKFKLITDSTIVSDDIMLRSDDEKTSFLGSNKSIIIISIILIIITIYLKNFHNNR